ncbi:MAG: GNAT family N-acetyltransferase [Deltaproteobacteria bacterium]|nr:GNAT family N-acetyltransferase [Deltaproteobacteria bacterium]
MEFSLTRYKNTNLNKCVDLLGDTWNFNRQFEELTRENLINILFFKFSIIDSNYNQVIIDKDDNVHGFIFGKVSQKSHINIETALRSVSTLLSGGYHYLSGHMGPRKKSGGIIREFLNIERDLTSRMNRDDAYVSLFFVGSSLRGSGYGTKLMNNFETSASKSGCKRIYLWTDKGCNYGYYDHCGFKRVIDVSSPVLEGYGEEPNGFAYIKPLQQK